MAVVNKTRNMLEGLVKEGSFKWLTRRRSSFDEEIEDMKMSPSAGKNWLPELSLTANVVVHRCSKILGLSLCQLRENFDAEVSDFLKNQSSFARIFLEYCCFLALAWSIHVNGYLDDKKFRRLTFDMMVAWEFPEADSEPFLHADDDVTVGIEAFSRIAPAVPVVADVVVGDKIFEVLAASTSNRLHFSVYDKYLIRLERAVRKLQTQSESSLLSSLRSGRREKILEVDGTVTTQPVLEHVGTSTWPGRLTLTDHALYFEALSVVSYDKAKSYDLADDLQQVVKPDLTGPWGTRLFDKAVFYKSSALSEPVVMEFPELKGHTRRDYWLAIIREVLYAHRFVIKHRISGLERDEVLLKAIFGILRLQSLKEMSSTLPLCFDSLLMFNVCDQLPLGDLVLEKLVNTLAMGKMDKKKAVTSGNGVCSSSALSLASNLGFVIGKSCGVVNSNGPVVGEIAVGEMTPLQKAVKEARSSYENVVLAQATVDGVKVDGIDTNLAVMKELLSPVMEIWNCLVFLFSWEEPLKSLAFGLVFTYIICKGWTGHALATLFIFFAVFMLLTRYFGQGKPIDELKVTAPPAMNTMEQLLAVQNAISQAEELIQDGNILLLKCRALLLSIFPQATERFAFALLVLALLLALLPVRYIFLLAFLEAFTRYSPLRRSSTERWMRRLRDWWFSIPAAPVILKRVNEDKKKR
ncbi:heat-inducible transcription repressor [Perilla frutescens var. hirtella]|uniref:Heat-inducible transcription repressor n=1 Tax=Perilla frutescens var. hirtella TaxID=608512 RepID=A0AAD4P127_PERFH|nr:heat-inducible transcription repressor [Perilla frutescens var. hirtella]